MPEALRKNRTQPAKLIIPKKKDDKKKKKRRFQAGDRPVAVETVSKSPSLLPRKRFLPDQFILFSRIDNNGEDNDTKESFMRQQQQQQQNNEKHELKGLESKQFERKKPVGNSQNISNVMQPFKKVDVELFEKKEQQKKEQEERERKKRQREELEREKREREKIEQEFQRQKRLREEQEKERQRKEFEQKRLREEQEKERQRKELEREEQEKKEKERLEKIEQERRKLEEEKKMREQKELEQREQEKREKERLEKIEQEQRKLAEEKKIREQKVLEQKEQEKKEKERLEKIEQEKLEEEKKMREQKELEQKEQEKKEKERLRKIEQERQKLAEEKKIREQHSEAIADAALFVAARKAENIEKQKQRIMEEQQRMKENHSREAEKQNEEISFLPEPPLSESHPEVSKSYNSYMAISHSSEEKQHLENNQDDVLDHHDDDEGGNHDHHPLEDVTSMAIDHPGRASPTQDEINEIIYGEEKKEDVDKSLSGIEQVIMQDASDVASAVVEETNVDETPKIDPIEENHDNEDEQMENEVNEHDGENVIENEHDDDETCTEEESVGDDEDVASVSLAYNEQETLNGDKETNEDEAAKEDNEEMEYEQQPSAKRQKLMSNNDTEFQNGKKNKKIYVEERPCVCNWGPDCDRFQKYFTRLKEQTGDCLFEGKIHPKIGVNSERHANFLDSVDRHLKTTVETRKMKQGYYFIAKHHFTRPVLEYVRKTGLSSFIVPLPNKVAMELKLTLDPDDEYVDKVTTDKLGRLRPDRSGDLTDDEDEQKFWVISPCQRYEDVKKIVDSGMAKAIHQRVSDNKEMKVKKLEEDQIKEIKARDARIAKLERRNKELERRNKELEQYSKEMEQKSMEVEHYSKEMEQKSKEMEQRSKEMEQRNKEMEQRSKEMEQRNNEMEQRSKEMAQKNKEMEQLLKQKEDELKKAQGMLAVEQMLVADLEDQLEGTTRADKNV